MTPETNQKSNQRRFLTPLIDHEIDQICFVKLLRKKLEKSRNIDKKDWGNKEIFSKTEMLGKYLTLRNIP